VGKEVNGGDNGEILRSCLPQNDSGGPAGRGVRGLQEAAGPPAQVENLWYREVAGIGVAALQVVARVMPWARVKGGTGGWRCVERISRGAREGGR